MGQTERLAALETSVEEGMAVVRGIRLFDHRVAQEFAAEVTSSAGVSLPKFVIVDLSETTGVLSAAIVELISLSGALSEGNEVLVLCGLSEAAREAVRAASLEGFFITCGGMAEAKEELHRQMEV